MDYKSLREVVLEECGEFERNKPYGVLSTRMVEQRLFRQISEGLLNKIVKNLKIGREFIKLL